MSCMLASATCGPADAGTLDALKQNVDMKKQDHHGPSSEEGRSPARAHHGEKWQSEAGVSKRV